jgi:uncharacterized protein (TIGR02145 family)
MKNIKTTISVVLSVACLAVLLFADSVSAQVLQVSSVTVDSVWNSDSSWYDIDSILQQRQSRDCSISFTPQGEGMARMFIAMSMDSGKTWESSRNLLTVFDNALKSTFITGKKATITARVFGGDRPGVIFKMTARQAAPVIAGNPNNVLLGFTAILAAGQSVGAEMNLLHANATSTDGSCPLAKVYWDTLGDGTINDSTTGANALSWTWLTQVPAGAPGQKRSVIARAIDKNGLWSVPETFSVRFGLMVDSVTDIDGNVYHTVQIGTQEWTTENLRTTKYNDGTAIPKDTSNATWYATTPKYCYYNNTTSADSIHKFGALYNWYVVDPANEKKIAPTGWHVPTDSEWTTLENYLIADGHNWDGSTTGDKIAKALAGQTDWTVSTSSGAIGNDVTRNKSAGFSALPGGYRSYNGSFFNIGCHGEWWSSTEVDASRAWYRNLYYDIDYFLRFSDNKRCGFSVRLVRD